MVRIDVRQRGADHKLDLVERHLRQHDGTDQLAGEDDTRHGNPAAKALLRTSEDAGDAVCPVGPQQFAPGIRGECDERLQRGRKHEEEEQPR